MRLITGKVNSGKSKQLIQAAIETAQAGNSVLILTEEHSESYYKEQILTRGVDMTVFDQLDVVEVNNLAGILKALGHMPQKHVFLDASGIMSDMRNSLAIKYTGDAYLKDMVAVIQLNRTAHDIELQEYLISKA